MILATSVEVARTLYSKSSLGLDGFELQKQRTKEQLLNLADKFKERMIEYSGDDKNMIFTEDLKNMIYLAENDQDLELVVDMMRRYALLYNFNPFLQWNFQDESSNLEEQFLSLQVLVFGAMISLKKNDIFFHRL